MRSDAPPLLPILRSRTQGELLALLLLEPERDWTLSELARTLESPLTSVQAEVARLENAGLLTSRKIGRARLVRPEPGNPLLTPLTQLISLTFGPRPVITAEFALPNVDHVVIFGSWAARLAGEAGGPPGDIDVLVVGDNVDRDAVYGAADRAEARLGRPVNPVLRSGAAWANQASDPLIDEITTRPYVVVMSHQPATVTA